MTETADGTGVLAGSKARACGPYPAARVGCGTAVHAQPAGKLTSPAGLLPGGWLWQRAAYNRPVATTIPGVRAVSVDNSKKRSR